MENKYSKLIVKTEMQFCFIAILICFSVTSSFAQSRLIAEKYLKITPTVSMRDDVEKLFGKGNAAHHNVLYQTDADSVVSVEYSYGDCNSGAKVWGIPEWTVEEIYYVPREEKPLRLRDVIFDFSKFKKRQSGDVLVHIDYYNEDAGITVGYDKKEKTVNEIIIYPTLEQKRRLACAK